MSRQIPFTGAQLAPGPAALWSFQSKLVLFTAGNQLLQLYPPPGPVLVEWFYIQADIFNDDFVAIGERDVALFSSASPPATQCITTLGPGEWCCWEPNDKGDSMLGLITAPDGDTVQMSLLDDIDLLDVTQFFGRSGLNTSAGVALNVTIGVRSRR